MGIEDLGLLLENIEEYVMEQKKIVTYKWLSRTFSLNVNQAKQLLAIFHKKHKALNHKSIQGIVNNRPVTPPALKNKVKVMAPGVSETSVKAEPNMKTATTTTKKQGTLLGTGNKVKPVKEEPKQVEAKKSNKNSLNNFFGKGIDKVLEK
eukprot:sb/3473599/